MNHKERNRRLTRLLPAIQARATHYVLTYRPDLDPLDIAQEAALAFLQHCQADPAFLNQDDDTLIRRCVLDGWNATRRQHHHDHLHIPLEPTDGESTFPTGNPGPEQMAIAADLAQQVQQIIAHLKPAYRTVCQGLLAGLSKKATMESIGTQKQAWSHYRRQLACYFETI